jgi:hypothetical protein
MPHPPKLRHIGQTVHTRGSAYATCYALQPFAAHRCKGRGLGIESTAALLLPSPQWSEQGILLFLRYLQVKRRADERTRTADLLITSVRSVVAERCRGLHGLAIAAYISRFAFSGLLSVAPYCVPGGIRLVSIAPSRAGDSVFTGGARRHRGRSPFSCQTPARVEPSSLPFALPR